MGRFQNKGNEGLSTLLHVIARILYGRQLFWKIICFRSDNNDIEEMEWILCDERQKILMDEQKAPLSTSLQISDPR